MPKTIMTVDDAATMRKMICFTLRAAGYEMLEASNGGEALALASSRKVDLVITDLHMPQMDGIELTQNLRRLPACAKAPILILTTDSDTAKKTAARAAGATGWILKPFTPEQLLAAVRQVLR